MHDKHTDALVDPTDPRFILYRGRRLARVMGGSPTTYPDAIVNPLAGPTISGTQITVDTLLNQPTRVTRIVADMVMANFFLDRVFATGGGVEGGAVLYDQAQYLDIYTDRDVERVEPGEEFPIVTGLRVPPKVAYVEKFGGKFPVTNEARRRNNVNVVNNQMRRVANTIVRKMNQRGMSELAAGISAFSRTATGVSWSSAAALTYNATAKSLLPGRDLAAVQAEAELNEFGYSYNTLIVHPNEAQNLRIIYADTLDSFLNDHGITNFISTPRQTSGQAYVLAEGDVGELRLEEPMRTTVQPEPPPQMREQDWVQSAVNPVMYVTDPYAIIQINGLA